MAGACDFDCVAPGPLGIPMLQLRVDGSIASCLIQMQSSGQHDNVESTALAKEDRADNSDVPKIQRESIRTRRERLHGMRVNIERTLAVGGSQEFLDGSDIFSIRLQQGDEGVTGRMPADLLVNVICLRNSQYGVTGADAPTVG